jgi:hypothetical protein
VIQLPIFLRDHHSLLRRLRSLMDALCPPPSDTPMVTRLVHPSPAPAPAPRTTTKFPQTAASHSPLVTSNTSASSVHISIASPDADPAPTLESVYLGSRVSLFPIDDIVSLLGYIVPSLDHYSVPTGPFPSEICTPFYADPIDGLSSSISPFDSGSTMLHDHVHKKRSKLHC